MNAQVSSELADLMLQMTKTLTPSGSIQCLTNTIRKADILCYYRETKQAFLNLGGLLISQTDGWFYLFNTSGELVSMDRIQI